MKPGDIVKLQDSTAMVYGMGKIEEIAVGRATVWQFDYVQLLLMDGSFRTIRKKTGEYSVEEPAFEQLILQHKQLEMIPREDACRVKASSNVPNVKSESSTPSSTTADQPKSNSPSSTIQKESQETSVQPTVSSTGPTDSEVP